MFAAYRSPTPPSPAVAAPPGPGPCTRRLHHDIRLHVAFRRLHRCGPRPLGFAVAALLDDLNADPSCLDAVLLWCALNSDLVEVWGGDDFPRPPLDLVPPS